MPSFWTHASFAEEARQMLSELSKARMPMGPWSRAILAYPHAYWIGMQGPDLFLFYPPAALGAKGLGTLLHTQRTPDFLCALFTIADSMEEAEEKDRLCALSYACGFLGHYLLDSRTHAFIYARAGVKRSLQSFCIHNALEADLSRIIVERSLGLSPGNLPDPAAYRLSPAEQQTLSCLLARAISCVYQLSVSPSSIRRAFRATHTSMGILYDSTGRKGSFAHFLEAPFKHPYLSPLFLGESAYYSDPANLAHRLWHDPYTGRSSHADFLELYDHALDIYLPLLHRLELLPSPRKRRIVLEKLCRLDFHGEPIDKIKKRRAR